MPNPAWLDAVRWMARHDGLATREALVARGLSARTLERRTAQGLLVRVNARVVALPGAPLDLATLTRAAVLALPDAVPTGPAAAALLGPGPWDGMDLGEVPWLVHPRRQGVTARYVSRPGVRTVRAAGLDIAHPREVVVDLIRLWPWHDAVAVAQRALQLRTVRWEDLLAAHAAMPGFAGNAQLAKVIAAMSDGTRSEAERRLVRLLRESGIQGWVANHRVRVGNRGWEVDVAFPAARLAIEVDGRAFHSDSGSFQRDRRKQNDLVADGWTVLRFTWDDLARAPHEVLARIVAALERLAA
ncbi:MAG: DUF559 domain-containing protein [Candidatus Nanopelagicales bacterium]|jgi:very-short-patch-repair endonuclease|nr:DUF559 domain-containing protein [Candidatus Nanopelagicales bacterium]